MPFSDGVPSSPPGSGASLEDSLAYYKAQYESLESELADFQDSSKALEAELEKDIEASEKRERELKEKAANLAYEVDEWKTKYRQAKSEANTAQNTLQKEITTLRDANRTLQLRLRDTEVANDDFERKQRNTESSLEDLESKYSQTIEREVMLEEEMRVGEQEREALRIEAQRLRDEYSDLKIEADITKEKLRKAEEALERKRKELTLRPIDGSGSPRSELSPTTTTTSSPSFDTPPTKTASSSGLSDAPTPPSPPVSEKSNIAAKPITASSIPKSRISMNANNTTPRQPTYSALPSQHSRAASAQVNNGRSTPSLSFRQSMSKSGNMPYRQAGLPQSNSIYHLRNLRGKMQKLEERVHTAKSKLPAPVSTPPKISPRSGSALGHHIPASVTVRSNRRRAGGSTVSGVSSISDQRGHTTPAALTHKSSRPSFGQPPATPTRGDMAAPPPRPGSRASISSRSSINPYVPGHSRPGSRASISNLRAPLGSGVGHSFVPNASTDRVRPKSSLSNYGYDGQLDEENGEDEDLKDTATPTPRRTTLGRRTSEIGTAIPSPSKRISVGGASKLPALSRRQSSGLGRNVENDSEMRPPPSRDGKPGLSNVGEHYDVDETF
jgi:hypothetical protein